MEEAENLTAWRNQTLVRFTVYTTFISQKPVSSTAR